MSAFDPANDYWSDQEDAELTRLWAAGEPLNAISGALGKRTRNAVSGRVHRLGLPHRISPIPFHQPSRGRELAAGFLAAREAIARAADRVTPHEYVSDPLHANAAFELEVAMARLKASARERRG